jgi:23S rRNA (guanosine2251-2'-O)-methyltransferase
VSAQFKGLDEDGLRTIYGVNPVREALRAGRHVTRLVVRRGLQRLHDKLLAEGRPESVEVAAEGRLSRFAGTEEHQGVAAKVEALANTSVNHLVRTRGNDLLFLALDGVQDPHNLGAILRVADGAGVDLVIVPAKGAASVQLGSVAKSSAGAVEHVPVLVVGDLKRNLKELEEHGIQRVALEADGKHTLDAAPLMFPLCLVLGGEGSGVTRRVRDVCDTSARLTLRGKVNSLNVSVATAIAAFHVAALRPGAGDRAG